MSRFTSAYHVNRPSAQQLADRQSSGPAANLNNVSPPYTDDLGFPANASSNSHLFGHSNDLSLSGLPSLATLSETPTRMPNRTTTSVLGYNHSGRERSRQRASRWLILVIPPTFITESRGVLGHTLSSSPSSRLSQGLLLPLYPTVSQSVPRPSEYCVSYPLVAFQLKSLDVCATGRDRARVQFSQYCGDLPVYARQRSRCSVYTADKRGVMGYPLGTPV